MDKVRIGVIGVGNMGSVHARCLQDGKIKLAELAAICDLNPDKLKPFGTVKRFTDSTELIRSGAGHVGRFDLGPGSRRAARRDSPKLCGRYPHRRAADRAGGGRHPLGRIGQRDVVFDAARPHHRIAAQRRRLRAAPPDTHHQIPIQEKGRAQRRRRGRSVGNIRKVKL